MLEDESEFGANRRQISIEGLGLVYDYEVRGGKRSAACSPTPSTGSAGPAVFAAQRRVLAAIDRVRNAALPIRAVLTRSPHR